MLLRGWLFGRRMLRWHSARSFDWLLPVTACHYIGCSPGQDFIPTSRFGARAKSIAIPRAPGSRPLEAAGVHEDYSATARKFTRVEPRLESEKGFDGVDRVEFDTVEVVKSLNGIM